MMNQDERDPRLLTPAQREESSRETRESIAEVRRLSQENREILEKAQTERF